jgi:hypothetical protein
MARRTATSNYTGSPRSEVAGSSLDPGQINLVRLPPGLDPEVRKAAKRIIETNPHLDDSQRESIVRLAKMRIRVEAMEADIAEKGFMILDEAKGRELINPLVPALSTASNAVLSLERAMAISFVTRNGQTKQHERKRPAVPAKPTKSADGGRVLKLA